MLEVSDVDFIRPCVVIVFALFHCHLDLCCGECYVGCPQSECVPVYVSVCFVCFIAFCALMLFPCSILCLMCSGSSLHVECILPPGMLCLSAWRMMPVKMVFAVCICGGGRM